MRQKYRLTFIQRTFLKEEGLGTEFAILEKRLRRIESQNRRLWWLAILLLVFAAGVAWGKPETYPVVKARELDLPDSSGRVRGQFIDWGEGAPVLELYGGDTAPSSMLSPNRLGIFAPTLGKLPTESSGVCVLGCS